ncbi:hypothetical protein BU14_0118s0028 [Porphyra umbilicalis]|uniref:Protein kinase domain-containing protein n=1 Tax=Porphyra umbilicalis TaxID=2786 RepID=A0A1X6PBG3_PORUM|nr:hypothetical protein BU14_0118s0028 [Porphyra umbilicalis]|eukprot:OSX78177.1 hypothetical protein BU14_0118s0028 [Porphyra umbilicalis]
MDALVTSCPAAAISSLPDGRRRLLEARLGAPSLLHAAPQPTAATSSGALAPLDAAAAAAAAAARQNELVLPTDGRAASSDPAGAADASVAAVRTASHPQASTPSSPPRPRPPAQVSYVRDGLMDVSRSFVLTGDEAEDEEPPPSAVPSGVPAASVPPSPPPPPVTAAGIVATRAVPLTVPPTTTPLPSSIRPTAVVATPGGRGASPPPPPEETAEDSFGSFSSRGSRGSASGPARVRVVTPGSRRTQPRPAQPPGTSNSSRDSGDAVAAVAPGGGAAAGGGRRVAGGTGRKRGRGSAAAFEPTKNARLEQYFKPAGGGRAARLAAGSPGSSAAVAATATAGLSSPNSRSSRPAPDGVGGATCSSWGVTDPPGDSRGGGDRPPAGPAASGGGGSSAVGGGRPGGAVPATVSLGVVASPIRSDGGRLPTPRRLFAGVEEREAGSATTSAPPSPAQPAQPGPGLISAPVDAVAAASAAAAAAAAATAAEELRVAREEAAALKAQLEHTSVELQAGVRAAKAEALREAEAARAATTALTESRLAASTAAAEAATATESVTATRSALEAHIRAVARHKRADAVVAAAEASRRLGHIEVQRAGTSLHEVWEDGAELKAMGERLRELATRKEATEKRRKELAKQLRALSASTPPLPPASSPSARSQEASAAVAAAAVGDRVSASAVPHTQTAAYLVEQEEVCKLQLLSFKKDEAALADQRSRAEAERALLIRELKRQRDEAASRFHDYRTLNDRYVLMSLLGRGGFSEVYKAYDLVGLRHVACKIHQLGTYWREEKKRNYIRHATREYRIHKALTHPRVVQLLDVFEIDASSFCTVLEFCDGGDLDGHLKARKTLPEREARSITAQVLAGLLYLSEQPRRVIHYDLKPGNILFHDGEARITDFGLSKQMDAAAGGAAAAGAGGGSVSGSDGGMELTSQGAGTYWYLPPECFEVGDAPPKISAKVDVWSTGVILYQMLFGRRPFGHDLTQEGILRDHSVLNAQLVFPVRPAVSDSAKTFLLACLTRSQAERPNIRTLLQHPFIKAGRKAV